MNRPSRASFAGTVAAAGASAWLGFPRGVRAQSAAPQVLHLASAPDDDVTPMLYAREAGLFKAAGLGVEIAPLANGSAVAAAIAGGAIDIGKASLLSIINAHTRGVPFVIVAPCAAADLSGSYSGLVVTKDSPVQAARDLNGKTVSVPALHDVESLATQTWIDKNGGDSKSIAFVEAPVTAVGLSLDAGRIAAGIMTNPSLAQAMASGKYRRLARPVEEAFNHLMIAAWISTVDWSTKNAAVVRKFLQINKTATAYAIAHPDKTLDLIAAFSGMDRTALSTMTRAAFVTTLDPALVQPLIDDAARYGAIPKSFNAAELFSPITYSR